MIQFAVGAGVVKELAGILSNAVEDPNSYKRVEGLRAFLCKVTGKEIDKSAFLELLETTTQGDPYTGLWEDLPTGNTRRLRVEGGWIFDIGRGHPLLVLDK